MKALNQGANETRAPRENVYFHVTCDVIIDDLSHCINMFTATASEFHLRLNKVLKWYVGST